MKSKNAKIQPAKVLANVSLKLGKMIPPALMVNGKPL